MAEELNVRYYKPKEEFKLDIGDIENFVYDMSRCIKCKGCTWVEHTYMPGAKFMTRCPSATKYEFDAYGAYGKMRIGHAMAEGRLYVERKGPGSAVCLYPVRRLRRGM